MPIPMPDMGRPNCRSSLTDGVSTPYIDRQERSIHSGGAVSAVGSPPEDIDEHANTGEGWRVWVPTLYGWGKGLMRERSSKELQNEDVGGNAAVCGKAGERGYKGLKREECDGLQDPTEGDTIPHRRVTTALRPNDKPLLLHSSSTTPLVPVAVASEALLQYHDPHHNGAHREGFTPLKQKFWIRLYRRTITVLPYLPDFTTFDVLAHPLRCASSFRGVYDGGGRVDPGNSEICAGFRHPATPSTGWIPLRARRVEFPARLRRVRAPPATSTGVTRWPPSAATGLAAGGPRLEDCIWGAGLLSPPTLPDFFLGWKIFRAGRDLLFLAAYFKILPTSPTTKRRTMAAGDRCEGFRSGGLENRGDSAGQGKVWMEEVLSWKEMRNRRAGTPRDGIRSSRRKR
ncbi:hypothetical protein R3P38DRAFT_3374084 [Favolaschia claudopus]|uniref:Uncharacterized protein n=1 Tax=Favolaschia claudopus TaxID=2862362 RepID=A0AAV9ZNY4_9AGAR